MIPFLVLYLSLLIGTVLTYNKTKYGKLIFQFSCVLVFLLPALRDIHIGPDTYGYVRFFINPSEDAYLDNVEPLFRLYNVVLRFIWPNPHFYLMVCSLLSLGGFFFIIDKKSNYKELSLLLFVLVGLFYQVQFYVIRQSISISLFLVAMYFYADRKKYMLALLFYTLALFMHATVLYTLPVVLLVKRMRFSPKFVYIVLAVSLCIGVLGMVDYRAYIDLILNYLTDSDRISTRYANYGSFELNEDIPLKSLILSCLPYTLCCIICYRNFQDKENLYLKLFFVSCVIRNIMCSYTIVFRLIMYFEIFLIFLLPLACGRKKFALYVYIPYILFNLYAAYNALYSLEHDHVYDDSLVPYCAFFY